MRASLPLRAVLVALLVAALAVPSFAAGSGVTASVRTPAASASSGGGALAQLGSWLRSMWTAAGCGIDPDGKCGPGAHSAPLARPDAGCGLDPSGKCQPGTVVSGS
jgi:hypothetical protein